MPASLASERLRGECIATGHLADFEAILADPLAMATLGPVADAREARSKLEQNVEHWSRHGIGKWLLYSRAAGSLVGYVGLQRCHVEGHPEVELAYALLPRFWGQGLASEASRAASKRAFDDLALDSLVAFTLPTNTASRRVMEAAGFRYERDIIHAGRVHVLCRREP